jgi:hypothetical protein
VARGLVAAIGQTAVWRWLSQDAIRPWCHRNWIFSRDPDFAHNVGRVLDLYEGRSNGKPPKGDEYVISTNEKIIIQARRRLHPTQPRGAD